MSDQQIKQILERLNQQDKLSEERMSSQFAVYQSIRSEIRQLQSDIKNIQSQSEPMFKIFDNVSGFNKVMIVALKGLVLLGAGIGVIYGFLSWIKQ